MSARGGGWIIAAVLGCVASAALAQGRAAVPVERGDTLGAIAGRACRDVDGDGRCSSAEPGYPGLRLVLETGHQVVTDANGRFHFAGVPSRAPGFLGQVRLQPGRHRVRADARGLLPGSRVVPEAVTLEVTLGALVKVDFAVQEPTAATTPVEPAHQVQPPTGAAPSVDDVRFEVSGRTSPGDAVFVADEPASVDPSGVYRARVRLREGENEVPIRVESRDGGVRLFSQRIDVVWRPDGALVVPREIRPTARVQLPGTTESPAAAGAGRLRVEGEPGTIVVHQGVEKVIGPEGSTDIPVELGVGQNVVPLRIQRPGEVARDARLTVDAQPRPFVVGLLDVEGTYRIAGGDAPMGDVLRRGRVFGRGAAHGELPLGKWLLEGEVDLRDEDLQDARAFGLGVLAQPRDVTQLERWLDPEDHPYIWGDDSAAVVPNAPDARVRLELRHPDLGGAGFGTYRAQFQDSEAGRYHRELFGPWLRVHTPRGGTFGGGLEAFASQGAVDPTTGLTTRPAHAEFLATGGSLFFLPHAAIARGSEQVRIVYREGLTGLPLSERHLVRGVDYELDALSGRILLASPLSFASGGPFLRSDLPTAGVEPVLVVDYERLELGGPSRAAVGAEATGRAGPVSLSIGGVQEGVATERYRLLRASAQATVGRITLLADAAQSGGSAHSPGDVSLSESGGLDHLFAPDPDELGASREGWAFTLRARGQTFGDGRIEGSFRHRDAGFSDAAWDGRGPLRQISVLADQPLGPVHVGLLGDLRRAADPREPFGARLIDARTLGAWVGYRASFWGARVEAKDQHLIEDPTGSAGGPVEGGRTSVGVAGRLRVHERVWLQAAHRQAVQTRGEGAGAWDDSFSSVGADVKLDERSQVGVHGGWGPRLGALAWVNGQLSRGADVHYGSYSVDVDGPDYGERRSVTGARTTVDANTAVFVEDVAAHDANAIRMARAVGLSYALADGLSVSARYERGVRSPLDLQPPLRRDAGGFSVMWTRDRVRVFGRAEARFDRGRSYLGAREQVDRVQRLASAAVSLDASNSLSLGGRLNWAHTENFGRMEARLLEASAGATWRTDPAMVVLQYAVERELAPQRRSFGERSLQRVSLLPTLKVGDRVALGAGAHAGWSTTDGEDAFVLSGSVRPSVRVVGGLEVAAELARRSAAPGGGELSAARGELGYRFSDELLVAGGYTFFGYEGLGLTPSDDEAHRLYVRAEAAW